MAIYDHGSSWFRSVPHRSLLAVHSRRATASLNATCSYTFDPMTHFEATTPRSAHQPGCHMRHFSVGLHPSASPCSAGSYPHSSSRRDLHPRDQITSRCNASQQARKTYKMSASFPAREAGGSKASVKVVHTMQRRCSELKYG